MEREQLRGIVRKVEKELEIEIKGTFSYQLVAAEMEKKQEKVRWENAGLVRKVEEMEEELRKREEELREMKGTAESDKMTIIQQEERVVRYEKDNGQLNFHID